MKTEIIVPSSEEKTEHKISHTMLGTHIKHAGKKAYKHLGTGGTIAVILGILLIGIILSYEHRLNRIEHGWYLPYRMHTVMPNPWVDTRWIDDMDKAWSEAEKRQQTMLKKISEAPKNINDGQYTGYRVENGKTFQYTVEIKDATMTGTLLGTDNALLTRYQTELTQLGITVTPSNGQVQFSAPKEKLESIIKVLNTK